MADNHGFTLNADQFYHSPHSDALDFLARRHAFLFEGQWANADPVGDFSRKLASSVSRLSSLNPSRRILKPRRRGFPARHFPKIKCAAPAPSAAENATTC